MGAIDKIGIYMDIRGVDKSFSSGFSYLPGKITKDEALNAWGAPDRILEIEFSHDNFVKIYGSTHYERWIYYRNLSFGDFAPIIILPTPIFWWPNGYYKTQLDFYSEGLLHFVSQESGKSDLGYVCFLIPPYCTDSLDLH